MLTSIFTTTIKLIKKIEVLTYKVLLLTAEVDILQNVNEAFSKHKRTKKTYIYKKVFLNTKEVTDILAQSNVYK